MSWEIRMWRAGAVYHVTNRIGRGKLGLTPGPLVNLFAEGCLARAAHEYGMRIIAFIIMGNHFHLIVEPTRPNLDAFMGYFQRELSHRLNKSRGEEGKNFLSRYRCEEIGSPEAFEDEVARTLCNPVRARLVGEADQWPGASSLPMHRERVERRTVLHASRNHAEAMKDAGLTPAIERSLEPLVLVPRTASMTPVEPPSPAIAVSTRARRCSGIACARLLALPTLARLNGPGRGQRDEAKEASRVDAAASSRRSQHRDRRADTPRWGHTYGPGH